MSLKFVTLLSFAALSVASTFSIDRRDSTFPYKLLKKFCINEDCSATRITISHPPINLWDADLINEFNTYLLSINNTEPSTPKVVVFSSDVPNFFISALDLHLLSIKNPVPATVNVTDTLNKYYENLDMLSNIPVIFVAEINGIAQATGNEHAMHMDMRFAGPAAMFTAPEVAVGLIHVGATQWLVESIGPSQTMELILSSAQVGAAQAAEIGWVNSMYDSEDALKIHINALVTRIAKFPATAIRATKRSVSQQMPTQQQFANDQAAFAGLASDPAVQVIVDKILEFSHNQGPVWELNNSDNIVQYLLQ